MSNPPLSESYEQSWKYQLEIPYSLCINQAADFGGWRLQVKSCCQMFSKVATAVTQMSSIYQQLPLFIHLYNLHKLHFVTQPSLLLAHIVVHNLLCYYHLLLCSAHWNGLSFTGEVQSQTCWTARDPYSTVCHILPHCVTAINLY